jgi:hypothetical protein
MTFSRTSINHTITVTENLQNVKFSHTFDLRNEGPSRVRELEAVFFIPIAVTTSSNDEIELFKMSDESIKMLGMVEIQDKDVPEIDAESMEYFSQRNYSEIITCGQADKTVCRAYKAVLRGPLKNDDTLTFQVEMVAELKNICKKRSTAKMV